MQCGTAFLCRFSAGTEHMHMQKRLKERRCRRYCTVVPHKPARAMHKHSLQQEIKKSCPAPGGSFLFLVATNP